MNVRVLRLLVGAVACVALPGASRLVGQPLFAWSMYARAGAYQIDIVAWDSEGRPHRRNATALVDHAAPLEGALLSGSEHWREGPSMAALRAHIGELAAYACADLHAVAIDVTLHEQPDLGTERVTRRHRVCSP